MNKSQIEAITKGLIEASKMGTVNALTYIQKGLEAYKTVEIPFVSHEGNNYYQQLYWIPYKEDKDVRTFVDFMLVYLDEAIKSLEKDKSK